MREHSLTDLLSGEDRGLSKLITLLSDLAAMVRERIPLELGMSEGVNVYGEKQMDIDVWSNDLFVKKLLKSGLVRQVASEEMGEVAESKSGDYSVVLDPLDGSSNIRSNNLLGTIVGVYHDTSLPAKGRNLLAAMYFLYGPFLQLVIALHDGVRSSVAAGKGAGAKSFISDGEIHKLPKPPTVYGIGGLKEKWTAPVKQFAESLDKRRLSVRYGGSFVGDYNQVLSKGGFFAYPELVDSPQGKYRLQFESNPVGFITEKAGGKAVSGIANVLDIEPDGIVQKVPTYLGDPELVSEFQSLYAKGSTA